MAMNPANTAPTVAASRTRVLANRDLALALMTLVLFAVVFLVVLKPA